MRHIVTLLLIIPCIVLAVEAPSPHFQSWYDGWGTHTVWGIGKVQGSYRGTSVTCGGGTVPVIAIYDTHANHEKPRPDQSAEFARQANRRVLEQFREAKVSCTFILVGPDEA